jgi:hypothetical protein
MTARSTALVFASLKPSAFLCLEAFGHVDDRLVECGALFDQATSQLATPS